MPPTGFHGPARDSTDLVSRDGRLELHKGHRGYEPRALLLSYAVRCRVTRFQGRFIGVMTFPVEMEGVEPS